MPLLRPSSACAHAIQAGGPSTGPVGRAECVAESPVTVAAAAVVDPPERVYRPRHPERTPIYRTLDSHFDEYTQVHEERFEERHGTLRPVVQKSVAQYLDCGRLTGGFARIRCPKCAEEHLLAFSCRTRNLCPSCQSKRSFLFGQHLRDEVVTDVNHRHVVFTIPKVLRGLFERERRLLGLLARTAYETLRRVLREASGERDVVPGVVASIQTFGSYANFHPHVHAIVTEGVFQRDGTFVRADWPPDGVLEEAFRRILLAALVRAERLSEEAHASLLSWKHSGFSVFGGQRVLASDPDGLERLARYVTRVAMPTNAVTLREDGKAVLATPPDPHTGACQVVLDPIELVHALVTQIPDAGKHLVRYSGAYSHRFRGRVRELEAAKAASVAAQTAKDAEGKVAEGEGASPPPVEPVTPAQPGSAEAKRRSSWARVLKKVFAVDPRLCPKCRVPMSVVAWITDPVVIGRILEHRRKAGLESPFDARGPPAPPAS